MNFYRQTFTNAPVSITIPDNLRARKIEVIILPLEEEEIETIEKDANGYPIGFFEETAGSLPDFPDREPQGEYEIREEIE